MSPRILAADLKQKEVLAARATPVHLDLAAKKNVNLTKPAKAGIEIEESGQADLDLG